MYMCIHVYYVTKKYCLPHSQFLAPRAFPGLIPHSGTPPSCSEPHRQSPACRHSSAGIGQSVHRISTASVIIPIVRITCTELLYGRNLSFKGEFQKFHGSISHPQKYSPQILDLTLCEKGFPMNCSPTSEFDSLPAPSIHSHVIGTCS